MSLAMHETISISNFTGLWCTILNTALPITTTRVGPIFVVPTV